MLVSNTPKSPLNTLSTFTPPANKVHFLPKPSKHTLLLSITVLKSPKPYTPEGNRGIHNIRRPIHMNSLVISNIHKSQSADLDN